MEDEATYEDLHGEAWDIHNDHQDDNETPQEPSPDDDAPAQEPLNMPEYRVTITATVTASTTIDVRAKSKEAARTEIRAQLEKQDSQATTTLAESAAQAVRKDELDDLDIDVQDDD